MTEPIKNAIPSQLLQADDEKYLKSIGEWGNYQKLQLAELQNNYAEVQKLTTAIQKRENRGKVTINVGFNKGH